MRVPFLLFQSSRTLLCSTEIITFYPVSKLSGKKCKIININACKNEIILHDKMKFTQFFPRTKEQNFKIANSKNCI